MSKIRVDTVATLDESTSVPTATLTGLPARMTAAETNKANKGANSDITALNALTTAITIAQGGHGATTADGARSALGVTGRNRIINGDCSIAQRAAAAFGTATGGYAGPDRFYTANSASAGGQFTQSVGTILDGAITRFAIVQTVNTAIANTTSTNFWSGIVQHIEGYNCFDLVGSPVAVSFLFKTNVTGTFSVAVRDSTGSVSYNTSFAAVSGVPVKVSINVPAVPLAAVIPQTGGIGMQVWIGAINTGNNQAPASNVWNTGSYITVPSSTNWGATAGNYISLTDLQFEAGTVTPFERRNRAHELMLCRRYYYTTSVNWVCYQNAGNGYGTMLQHPVPMRASPSVVASGVSTINTTNGGVSADTINYWHSGSATASGVVQYSAIITFSAEL
jgi:hypothetical protein